MPFLQQPPRCHRALGRVLDDVRQFEHIVVEIDARRVGRDHPGNVGDAILKHFGLQAGIAAKRTIGKRLDVQRTAGFLAHLFRPGLHDDLMRHLRIGREHRELELLLRLRA